MTVAVIGAGLGGLRTCEALRQSGFDGRVVLIGAEKHLPYTRPPLSKDVLRGDSDAASATLRRAEELEDLDLDVRLGRTAIALDVDARTVQLDDGSAIAADDVVIATGATPRRLPGVVLDGVFVLRTLDESLALRAALHDTARVVIVGAGFIGLEVAASARALGCTVTVVDVLPAPLVRVLPPEVGAAMTRLHEDHEVSFRCGVGVSAVHGDTRVKRVALADGTTIPADVVVVGIGVVPETAWLDTSGLTLDNGVVCDEALRAAPGIWAIGDVARWRQPDGGLSRLEHWTNATEQAHAVANNIVATTAAAFSTVPYFWSDQYDAKLQALGFTGPNDVLHVVTGALDEPKWVGLLHRDDRLTGVVGLRSPGRVMKLRPLLAANASFSEALASLS